MTDQSKVWRHRIRGVAVSGHQFVWHFRDLDEVETRRLFVSDRSDGEWFVGLRCAPSHYLACMFSRRER
jgi:hypothetical protein